MSSYYISLFSSNQISSFCSVQQQKQHFAFNYVCVVTQYTYIALPIDRQKIATFPTSDM